MNALQRAVAARNAFTATLVSPAPRSTPQLSARAASERLFGRVYKDDPNWPTIDQVRMLADRVYNELGRQEYEWCMQRFGVTSLRVPDLWIGQYARFVEEVEVMLLLRASFGDAYRWLLYHPESNCWFEERDPAKVFGLMTNEPALVNATGIEEHEKAYRQQLGIEPADAETLEDDEL